jgi:hypothetical protein
LSVALGGLGDTPVPANYADNTGDIARTDVAVFQPGGGIKPQRARSQALARVGVDEGLPPQRRVSRIVR